MQQNKFEYLFKKNPNTELNIIFELYRGKLYCTILHFFINNCIHNFGKKIFSIKKSYSRTLTNLLSSWLFSLYSNYDFSQDPFLPSNYKDTRLIKTILSDFVKYEPKITNINKKIDIICCKLIKSYEINLSKLKKYKKCDYYIKNKNLFKITKKIKQYKRDTLLIDFYKFNIDINFNIKNKRLFNIINNILIPTKIYYKLKNKYTGPINEFDNYLWIIIFRYQLLGSNNHQLGVLPSLLNKMKQDFNLNFECFASAINNSLDNYCSVYYDIEKYFGSKGSFFNLTPLSGVFGFNPPYQKDIIDNGIYKLFNHLQVAYNNNKNLSFIITIPIWDNDGKKIMETIFNSTQLHQKIDYGEFEIINDIKKNKFFCGLRMIPKNNFTYLDHNFHLYKNITIQNTYIIVLSTNKKLNIISYINKYDLK